MTKDEILEKLELMFQQQGQSTANITRLTAKIDAQAEAQADSEARLTAKIDALAHLQADAEARVRRVEESVALLIQLWKLMDERLDSMDERLSSIDGKVDALTKKVAELTDAQAYTAERLSALIDIFDRYVSRGSRGSL